MKIISGGQTGVDRAALYAALKKGLPIGGFVPWGYRAEDGAIPPELRPFLTQLDSPDYQRRTYQNVSAADATLVLWRGPHISPGSRATADFARAIQKPVYVVRLQDSQEEGIRSWLQKVAPQTLDVRDEIAVDVAMRGAHDDAGDELVVVALDGGAFLREGVDVPLEEMPVLEMVSDVGYALAKGVPFAAIGLRGKNGLQISLRSDPNGLNVATIAERFGGGGGHAHAAGYLERTT